MSYDRKRLRASFVIAVLAVGEVVVALATKSYVWLGLAGVLFALAAITYASSRQSK